MFVYRQKPSAAKLIISLQPFLLPRPLKIGNLFQYLLARFTNMKNLPGVVVVAFLLSIPVVSQRSDAALRGVTEKDKGSRSVDGRLQTLSAAEHLDPAALEGALKRGALVAGTAMFIDEALPRFLRDVGERWHRGSFTPAHEHLASDTVRRVLGWLVEAYDVARDAPVLLVATPSTEMHELGAMLAAAAAAGEGWRVVYLGPNLPAADIVGAASQVGAAAIALSVVFADGESTVRELRTIVATLPPGTVMMIGGPAAIRLERLIADTDIRVVRDLDSLRAFLRDRRAQQADVAAD